MSGFVYGSVDDTAKFVFYRGPPCVTPRKASGCCFASESHSHCSSIKHLLQPPPTAAALSFCIHTRAFHFKAKSQPALWKDISRAFRFNNVARRKTSNPTERVEPSPRIRCKTLIRRSMVPRWGRCNLFSGIRRCQWGRPNLKTGEPRDFGFLGDS